MILEFVCTKSRIVRLRLFREASSSGRDSSCSQLGSREMPYAQCYKVVMIIYSNSTS